MKDLALEAVERDCAPEIALSMKAKAEPDLVVPEFIKQFQKGAAGT